MDTYSQLKRFHCDCRLQLYMYYFMYVDTETIPVKDYFPSAKNIDDNYKKVSTLGPVPKHYLAFSYIGSEYYKLDMKFDEIYMKNQTTHPMIKLNYFAKILWS